MGKLDWSITNTTTGVNLTSSLLSFNYDYGRQSYMDNYAGSNLILTLRNNNYQEQSFSLNDEIRLLATNSGGAYDIYDQNFWVSEIQYNDYNVTAGNTITVICADAMNRLGRALGGGKVISSAFLSAQLTEMQASSNWPPGITTTTFGSTDQIGNFNINESYANSVNIQMATEKGILSYAYKSVLSCIARTYMYQVYTSTKSWNRVQSGSDVVYSYFRRIGLGQNFVNDAEVQDAQGYEPTQTYTNTDSTSLYGVNGITTSIYAYGSVAPKGLAEWIANSQSDTAALRYEITVDDYANTDNALQTLAYLFGTVFVGAQPGHVTKRLKYRVNAYDYDVLTVVEGWSLRATPDGTEFVFYLSPITNYQFFTLDSSTLGILNTSRLGWLWY